MPTIIGVPRRRVDGRAKVTGQTRFADDVMLPRMLHCKLLRSTVPHARIVRLDAARALAHPGVHLVLTGNDFPIPYGILPVSQDEHALAPHYVHRALAKALDMPAAHIRVIATSNGGGFGGKSDPFNHEVVVCKAAWILDRPVKICLTREEVFYCHRGRHPVLMHFKTGIKRDGTITGMKVRTLLDGGAYGSYGVASTFYTGALQTVTYRIPTYAFEGCRVFTNKPPCGPKRGHGTPQPRFALELHLEKIAQDIGLDPVELKRRNFVKPNTRTVNWLRVTSCGLEECTDKVMRASRYHERQMRPGHGMGFAISSYLSGAGTAIYWNDMPHSEVQIKVDRGGVTAYCGAMDIGQGSDSVLATIVAEELGLQPADIRLVPADTDTTPIDLGSYSSRVPFTPANPPPAAARRMRATPLQAA